MAPRHRSLPPGPRYPSSLTTTPTPTASANKSQIPTPPLIARHATTNSSNPSRLATHADALARMTLELNLRAVSNQANRMEKELKKLVLATASDAQFRAEHEGRLADMWREITAVRQRVSEHKDLAYLDAETSKRDVDRALKLAQSEVRREVEALREAVGGISAVVAGLPSAEEMRRVLDQETKAPQHEEPSKEEAPLANTQPLQQQHKRTQPTPTPKTNTSTPESRIREAINSTRRWNRDHKSTRLPDAVFCANYLRQQSKRDPTVAVFIQKAVQRRVKTKLATPASSSSSSSSPEKRIRAPPKKKPRNLDEFCESVEWADVRAAVEDTLVRDTTDVMRLLR